MGGSQGESQTAEGPKENRSRNLMSKDDQSRLDEPKTDFQKENEHLRREKKMDLQGCSGPSNQDETGQRRER